MHEKTDNDACHTPNAITLALEAVIVAVTHEVPHILTLLPSGSMAAALPYGPLDPNRDSTIEKALRQWVENQTGLSLGYVEQLYTFGDLFRGSDHPGARRISVAYLALTMERPPQDPRAAWLPWYRYLPWEDWRGGRPVIMDTCIESALNDWVRRSPSPAAARERADITFGLHGAAWDTERALERYELLYEAGLVGEARRGDAGRAVAYPQLGESMVMDHRRILATALGRQRGKIKYRPVVFELLPNQFTLLQLQRVVEALSGIRLHKQNFRRLVEHGGLVENTGLQASATGGRPAKLFSFRREVLRERPAPGVGLPRAFMNS